MSKALVLVRANNVLLDELEALLDSAERKGQRPHTDTLLRLLDGISAARGALVSGMVLDDAARKDAEARAKLDAAKRRDGNGAGPKLVVPFKPPTKN